MTKLKNIVRDFKTAPVASKSVNVRPANITRVKSREEANRAFAVGLRRAG
jgi:hypothetical protein